MTTTRLTPQQQKWVERVIPRIPGIAANVWRQVGTLAIEDFESAGYEAATRAALRYNPATGVPFATFAFYRIRGAMIDAVRAANPTVRRQKRALRALAANQALLEAQQAQSNPDTHDARTLQERVAQAAELIRQTTTAVMLAQLGPIDPDTIEAPDTPATDEIVIHEELRKHLLAALEKCNPPEQELIKALYFRDLSMHEYAAELNVNVSTVSRRHARLLRKLSVRMNAKISKHELVRQPT